MASATENRYINVFINGKQVGNTPKEITAAWNKLRNEVANTTVGSEKYIAAVGKMRSLDSHLQKHRDSIRGVNKTWESLKTTMLAVVGGNLVTAGLQRIVAFIPNLIRGIGETEDALADVRKTTGLSVEEVQGLSKALSKIDTRTSKKELLDMAVVAGQLGLEGQEAILGFVDATDKLNVALGDEFTGGAQEVSDTVGRLRNVLSDIKSDKVGDDLLKIGNGLNVLASKGSATAPVMTDFANRIGGIGVPLGLTSGQVLGLSATLQELNVSTERGGTAVSKILQKMTQDTKSFAKVAGMDAREFTELVNKDLFGAFMKVIEGSKKSGTSATALSKIISELELSGAGASEVFAKLGTSTGMLQEKVSIANEALTNTNSVMDEFNIKNNNAGAEIDKLGKEWNSLWTSEGVQNFGKGIISTLTDMVGWIKRNSDSIGMIIGVLAKALVVWGSYKTMQLLNLNAAKKWFITQGQNIAISILEIQVTQRAGLAKATLIATTNKLIGSIASMGKALLASPATWIALAYSIYQAVTAQSAYSKMKDKFSEIERDHLKNLEEEKIKTEQIFFALLQTNNGSQERKKLIDEINGRYGTTLKNYADEQKFLDEVNKQYTTLIKNMREKVDLQILQDQYAEARKNILEQREVIDEAKKEGAMRGVMLLLDEQLKEFKEEGARLEAEIGKKMSKMSTEQIISATGGTSTTSTSTTTGTDSDPTGKDKKTKEVDYQIEEAKRLNAEIKKLNHEFLSQFMDDEQKKILVIKDRYDKELELADESIAKLKPLADKGDKQAIAQIKVFQDIKKQLTIAKEEEIAAAIDESQQKQRDKEWEDTYKFWNEKADLEKRITEELMTEREKEKLKISQHYDGLIELAKKYFGEQSDYVKKLEAAKANALRTERKKLRDMNKEEFKAWAMDMLGEIEKYYGMFSNMLRDIDSMRRSKEDKALGHLAKNRDQSLMALEEAKKQELITEEQYEAQKQSIQEQFRQKERQLKREQWEREKKAKLADAIMNGIVAVTKTLASYPFPVNLILGGIVAGMAAAQVAAIANTEPPEFRRGGVFPGGGVARGATHEQGGIWMVDSRTGRKVGEMENNEPYMILSSNTYRNNKPIVDELLRSSQTGNGRPITASGIVGPTSPYSLAKSAKNVRFDKGGMFQGPGNANTGSANSGHAGGDMNSVIGELRDLKRIVENWPKVVKAVVVYRDLTEFEGKLQNVQNRGEMKPKNN